ncbi:Toxin FitB [Ensifer sp. M14]|nr:Toxin FitB [Ensifer sp. M14]
MYLIDTNPVSEARGGTPQAVSWLRSIDPLGIHLSALTLGEIMRGIALKQRSDPKTAAHLTEWLRKLRHDHGDRILPITDQIAVEWGRIAAIRPRGDINGLIAATAIVHDLILVTRTVKDFENTGASVINPGRRRHEPLGLDHPVHVGIPIGRGGALLWHAQSELLKTPGVTPECSFAQSSRTNATAISPTSATLPSNHKPLVL